MRFPLSFLLGRVEFFFGKYGVYVFLILLEGELGTVFNFFLSERVYKACFEFLLGV